MFGDFPYIHRSRHAASPEEIRPPQVPEPEHPSSPLRQRLAAGFWPHNHTVDSNRPKGRLRKKASNKPPTRSFTLLRRRQYEPGFRVLNTKFYNGTSEGTGRFDAHTQTIPVGKTLKAQFFESVELPVSPLGSERHHRYAQGSPTTENNSPHEHSLLGPQHIENENSRLLTITPAVRSKLVIHIPNSNKIPGKRKPPLLAHYPRRTPPFRVYWPKAVSKARSRRISNPPEHQSPSYNSDASSEGSWIPKPMPASKTADSEKETSHEPESERPQELRMPKTLSTCYTAFNNTSTPDPQKRQPHEQSKYFSLPSKYNSKSIENTREPLLPRQTQKFRARVSPSSVSPFDELRTMAIQTAHGGNESSSDIAGAQYVNNTLESGSRPPKVPLIEEEVNETIPGNPTPEGFRESLETYSQSPTHCEDASQIPLPASPRECIMASRSGFCGDTDKISLVGSRSDSGYETMHET